MEEFSPTTNASRAEVSQTGAAAEVNASLNPTESYSPSPADPVAAADVEGPSTGLGTPLPAMSSSQPSVAISIDPVDSSSDSCVTNPVVRISGITEIGRDSKTSKIISWKPPFEVQKGSETSFQEIFQRAESVRAPSQATPVPTGSVWYGSTEELFGRLQQVIAAQAFLPEQTSALLTFWTICTWFADSLPIAPGLAIVGPEFEGDLTLRTLRNICRYPLMLAGADITSLRRLDWRSTPTLLCFNPNITKQMATILGCATSRGYMVGNAGEYKDFYGPKATFIGPEVSPDRMPRCSLQVRLQPTSLLPATQQSVSVTEALVQDLRNQLQRYRCKNLVRVYNSDFDASLLTSDTRAVANALGACIVDSPKLQSNLISLLTPIESQRQADRATSIDAIALEATLNLVHQNKAQVLVNEISTEVNRIAQARGERRQYSAEIVGHKLKRVGLVTRRLGKDGRGLGLNLATVSASSRTSSSVRCWTEPGRREPALPIVC